MIFQLTYKSEANPTIDVMEIQEILEVSRKFNSRHGITGCLVYSDGTFVQLLEGESEIVRRLYNKIENDRRHQNVKLLNTQEVPARIFSAWAMAYLKPTEESQSGKCDKVQRDLLHLSGKSTSTEFELNRFWNDTYELLGELGYYGN